MKAQCTTCRGTGRSMTSKKAKEKRNPRVKQAIVIYNCKDCKGTGWVDPHD